MRYFLAGGRGRSPCLKLLAYASFFSLKFWVMGVAMVSVGGLCTDGS